MIEVRVPDEQEGTKAVVRAWLKQVGDAVAENDPLVELETDKVTQEVPAPASGVLAEIVLDTDAEAMPGALLGRISTGSPAKAGVQEAEPAASSFRETPSGVPGPRPAPGNGSETRLSPSVRRACLQHGINPARIAGTGRNGRVTREDVDHAVAAATVVSVGEPATAQLRQLAPQDIPHDRMRLKIAENMVRAISEAPHVTAVFEADFSAVAAHKGAGGQGGEAQLHGVHRQSGRGGHGRRSGDQRPLGKGPNRYLADDRHRRRHRARRERAGRTGRERRRIAQPRADWREARRPHPPRSRGQAHAWRCPGGSFTISNHGVSGSLLAAPIILHQGQAAILGVGKLEKRAVVREVDGQDAMVIRPMAYVTLTIDHRVVDGHQTNAWLTCFVEVLENWPAA